MGFSTLYSLSVEKSLVLIVVCSAFFGLGCGGMQSVRGALGGEPDIYVMTGKKEVALYVADMAGGEIVGRVELPEKFNEVESTVADVLRARVDGGRIRTSSDFTPPTMKRSPYLEEIELPDWKKTDIDVVAFLDISFIYEAISADGGVPPYGYKLKGSVTLMMGKTTRDGEIRPLMDEVIVLAQLEKKLDIKTRGIRGLKALMKVLPPTRFLDELNEKTRYEMKQFLMKKGV